MDGTEPRPRIRAAGIITAAAVAVSLFWEGAYVSRVGGVFAQVRVPIPALFMLLYGVAPWAYWVSGTAAFVLLAVKDLWVRERTAQRIDAVALAAAFLFYIMVEIVVKAPFMSVMEGIGRRS